MMRRPVLLGILALLVCTFSTPGAVAGEYVSASYLLPPPLIIGLTDNEAPVLDYATTNGTYRYVAAYTSDAVFGSAVPLALCFTAAQIDVCHSVSIGQHFFQYPSGVSNVRAWVYAAHVDAEMNLGGATTGEIGVYFV